MREQRMHDIAGFTSYFWKKNEEEMAEDLIKKMKKKSN